MRQSPDQQIALRDAALNDEEARRLAGLIARSTGARVLDLRGNEIGDALPIVDVIAEHPALARVDLRDNPLSEKSERALTEAVKANPRLTFVESPCPDDEERSRRLAFLCENRDRAGALRRGGAAAKPAATDEVLAALEALARAPGALDEDARYSAWSASIARLLRRREREVRPPPRAKPVVKERVRTPPAEETPAFQGHLCYVCKAKLDETHPSYSLMCVPCGDLNLQKREQQVDLAGRTFLLTGARTKIGFELGQRLLRSGARLIATTRFPHDCARAYAEALGDEVERLEVHALDLRDLAALEEFTRRVQDEHEVLHGLINLAAQTVWRPPEQYAHLLPREQMSAAALPPAWGPLVKSAAPAHLLRALEPEVRKLLPAGAPHELPLDMGPKQDTRETNSWRLEVSGVETRELVEVHVINAVAPFVLLRDLLPLLRASEGPRWVVNVSAVEGQFYRAWKGANHPHCNMAKAALNMLVRTTAEGLAKEQIYVTAVDTGWVSNDNPLPIKERMDAAGFQIPLTLSDGAARLYDPIARSLRDDEHLFGVFLKDYAAAPW